MAAKPNIQEEGNLDFDCLKDRLSISNQVFLRTFFKLRATNRVITVRFLFKCNFLSSCVGQSLFIHPSSVFVRISGGLCDWNRVLWVNFPRRCPYRLTRIGSQGYKTGQKSSALRDTGFVRSFVFHWRLLLGFKSPIPRSCKPRRNLWCFPSFSCLAIEVGSHRDSLLFESCVWILVWFLPHFFVIDAVAILFSAAHQRNAELLDVCATAALPFLHNALGVAFKGLVEIYR